MQKLSIFSLVFLVFQLLFSCTSAEDEKIVGTWRFVNIDERISEELAQKGTKSMSETDKNFMIKNASYVFNRNKTYRLNLGENTDQGMYYLSENGSALNMRSEQSSAVGRAIIQELTDEKLILVIQLVPQQHMQILTLAKTQKN